MIVEVKCSATIKAEVEDQNIVMDKNILKVLGESVYTVTQQLVQGNKSECEIVSYRDHDFCCDVTEIKLSWTEQREIATTSLEGDEDESTD